MKIYLDTSENRITALNILQLANSYQAFTTEMLHRGQQLEIDDILVN